MLKYQDKLQKKLYIKTIHNKNDNQGKNTFRRSYFLFHPNSNIRYSVLHENVVFSSYDLVMYMDSIASLSNLESSLCLNLA